jgi:radical SAM superfamily enzyme YgiQ (UPF0313 family)
MTPHLPIIHQEIRDIQSNDVLLAGGGPHISGEQHLAGLIGLDVLFVGPGEETFLQFGYDLLAGIVKKEPRIYRQQKAIDLSTALPVSSYFKTIPPLEIMRGCFWNCKYCQTSTAQASFRSLESIKLYLDEVKRRGFKRVNYISPSSLEYGASKGRLINEEALLSLFQLTDSYHFVFNEYGIFPAEIRPDSINESILSKIKPYITNKSITLGAQSGCNKRLKEIRRGHTKEDIMHAIQIANQHQLMVNLDFIIGYPDETAAERLKTLAFITDLHKKHKIRVHIHHFMPLSGSAYALRKPSFLLPSEKEQVYSLKKAGYASTGWIDNEAQALTYFQWLCRNFPMIYEQYH